MKKLVLFFLFGLLIAWGSSTKNNIYFSRYTEEIKQIKYNDLVLVREDYQPINDIIENISFSKQQPSNLDEPNGNLDIITVEDEIHHFDIYNNVIKYTYNNNTYYAKYDNTTLIKLYNETKEKYNDTDFFNITYEANYIDNEADNIIELENTTEALIFNTTEDIYDLHIYTTDLIGNILITKEIIYEDKEIIDKHDNIFKISLKTNPHLKIVFTTKYNNKIETTITYDKDIQITKKIISIT
jgi:hypothetical protein